MEQYSLMNSHKNAQFFHSQSPHSLGEDSYFSNFNELKGEKRTFDFYASLLPNDQPADSEVYYTSDRNSSDAFYGGMSAFGNRCERSFKALGSEEPLSFSHCRQLYYCQGELRGDKDYQANSAYAAKYEEVKNGNNQGIELEEEEEINPMIVFESYCIPQNFFQWSSRKTPRDSAAINTNFPFENKFARQSHRFQVRDALTHRVIEKSKDYDQNICRYVARLIIRQFDNEEFTDVILQLSECDEEILEEARVFFIKQLENISGHRAFRELILVSNKDSMIIKEYKTIFQIFSQWFLKERAVRYIIKGDMKDKLSYIRYKNDVMLFYIDCPEKWESNKVTRKKRLNKFK